MAYQVGILGAILAAFIAVPSARGEAANDELVPVKRGIDLAQKGRCREALPLLKKGMIGTGGALTYQSSMLRARCAMSLDQTQAAVEALLLLKREFPRDPEVLCTITQQSGLAKSLRNTGSWCG